MHHYKAFLATSAFPQPSQTDPASPMEKELLHWLASTALFQMHRDSLELIPQFPIGEYLRQLDPTYVHPAWRVDFLLRVPTTDGRTVQIVIEYDGFEHHFRNRESVHVGNYSRYMTAADIERQTILESYGYKFLRVNRFNIGADPVQSLSDRLERLVRLSSVHEWG